MGSLLHRTVSFGLSRSDSLLDLVRVYQPCQIRVGHFWTWKIVVVLLSRVLSPCSEDRVQSVECTFGPDTESSEMTARAQLEEVQSVDFEQLNSGNVAESLTDTMIFIVDDQRSAAHSVSSVPQFALSCSDFLRVNTFLDIIISTQPLQEGNSGLGFCQTLHARDNQRNFWDVLNLVSTGHDKGRKSGCGNARDGCVSPLVLVDVSVPSAPDSGWGKHASTSAHIPESSLTRSVGTSSTNTGNTCNGTTSSPRFSRGLVTSQTAHGIRLSLVLCHIGVDKVDHVVSDWGTEHGREGHLLCSLTLISKNCHHWTGRHFYWVVFSSFKFDPSPEIFTTRK